MNQLLELLGLAAIIVGVAVVFWPAALVVGGLGLVLIANGRDRQARRSVS